MYPANANGCACAKDKACRLKRCTTLCGAVRYKPSCRTTCRTQAGRLSGLYDGGEALDALGSALTFHPTRHESPILDVNALAEQLLAHRRHAAQQQQRGQQQQQQQQLKGVSEDEQLHHHYQQLQQAAQSPQEKDLLLRQYGRACLEAHQRRMAAAAEARDREAMKGSLPALPAAECGSGGMAVQGGEGLAAPASAPGTCLPAAVRPENVVAAPGSTGPGAGAVVAAGAGGGACAREPPAIVRGAWGTATLRAAAALPPTVTPLVLQQEEELGQAPAPGASGLVLTCPRDTCTLGRVAVVEASHGASLAAGVLPKKPKDVLPARPHDHVEMDLGHLSCCCVSAAPLADDFLGELVRQTCVCLEYHERVAKKAAAAKKAKGKAAGGAGLAEAEAERRLQGEQQQQRDRQRERHTARLQLLPGVFFPYWIGSQAFTNTAVGRAGVGCMGEGERMRQRRLACVLCRP